jgi:hypothetical protein
MDLETLCLLEENDLYVMEKYGTISGEERQDLMRVFRTNCVIRGIFYARGVLESQKRQLKRERKLVSMTPHGQGIMLVVRM